MPPTSNTKSTKQTNTKPTLLNDPPTHTMRVNSIILALVAISNKSAAQEYQDYAEGYAEQDNLYSDYAMKHQDGGGGGGGG